MSSPRDTMTAAVLTGHGGPESLRVKADHPVPEPTDDQVLVRVHAAALNNTDVWTRQGAYGLPGEPDALSGWRGPIEFPRIQGGDIAGVVVAKGKNVEQTIVGSRVVVDPAWYLDSSDDAPPVGLLGSEADGGFADYVAVNAGQAHDVSGSPLSDEQLACFPIAYGTAMGMLERAGIRSGETILITGASGGVGLALIQLAAARRTNVIAVTTSSKQEEVHSAGASGVVLRENGKIAKQVCALTDAVDAVADVAAGPLLNELIPLLRDDGRWVIAGAVAGPVIPFDVRRLYLHNLRLIGSSMHTRKHFVQLMELARAGSIAPVVARRFALTDIHKAQRLFGDNQHAGKIVIHTSGSGS